MRRDAKLSATMAATTLQDLFDYIDTGKTGVITGEEFGISLLGDETLARRHRTGDTEQVKQVLGKIAQELDRTKSTFLSSSVTS